MRYLMGSLSWSLMEVKGWKLACEASVTCALLLGSIRCHYGNKYWLKKSNSLHSTFLTARHLHIDITFICSVEFKVNMWLNCHRGFLAKRTWKLMILHFCSCMGQLQIVKSFKTHMFCYYFAHYIFYFATFSLLSPLWISYSPCYFNLPQRLGVRHTDHEPISGLTG